jgi:uncharacterized protein YegL
MNPFDAVDEIPRKVLTLFYLVDTSGSMSGAKIASLNTAIQETMPMIDEISQQNSDAKIKVAVLEFSSGCEWMYPTPQEVKDFQWRDLEASGLTSLGEAYEELNRQLSHTHGFMQEATGAFAPAIILMSDGAPTDDAEGGLNRLKNNNWFRAAIKVAIAIGDDANKTVLEDFAGNSEAVLTVHNIDQLKKIIRYVSVTASKVASKTTSVGKDAPETKNEENIQTLQKAIQDDPTLSGIDTGNSTTNSGTDDWTGW